METVVYPCGCGFSYDMFSGKPLGWLLCEMHGRIRGIVEGLLEGEEGWYRKGEG